MGWIKDKWCDLTHGGGRLDRDDLGRINWRCAKCGRWSDRPVPLDDEQVMTNRAIAARFQDYQAEARD